jgi:predicted DNA-binding protein
MAKTRKVQVTLEEAQYEELSSIAAREGRKLASVVRESIEKYTLGPEAERAKREALEALFSLEAAPVPSRYAEWKREYGARKTKKHEIKAGKQEV